MNFHKILVVSLIALVVTAGRAFAGFEDDDEAKKWEEVEFQMPEPPRQQDLLPFYVSASTDNQFLIDPLSVSVGADGVVRYTLIVVVPSGTRNVSFEGMRCETKERRVYAFGRADGAWSKARSSRWERVKEAVNNRHHAALFQDYFCPDGVIVRSAEEARGFLRRGGYSSRVGG